MQKKKKLDLLRHFMSSFAHFDSYQPTYPDFPTKVEDVFLVGD